MDEEKIRKEAIERFYSPDSDHRRLMVKPYMYRGEGCENVKYTDHYGQDYWVKIPIREDEPTEFSHSICPRHLEEDFEKAKNVRGGGIEDVLERE